MTEEQFKKAGILAKKKEFVKYTAEKISYAMSGLEAELLISDENHPLFEAFAKFKSNVSAVLRAEETKIDIEFRKI